MSSGRQRNNPVDAALAKLADLAGRGMKPARLAREVDTILSAWSSGPAAVEADVQSERLGILHEHLVNGANDAAEQVSDIDRGDAAALRHATAVHAALVGALDAIEQARATPQSAIPNPVEKVVAAPEYSLAMPTAEEPAVTIAPLAERNPLALHLEHPEEVRADVEAALPLAAADASQPKAKKRKPRKSSHAKEPALSLAIA